LTASAAQRPALTSRLRLGRAAESAVPGAARWCPQPALPSFCPACLLPFAAAPTAATGTVSPALAVCPIRRRHRHRAAASFCGCFCLLLLHPLLPLPRSVLRLLPAPFGAAAAAAASFCGCVCSSSSLLCTASATASSAQSPSSSGLGSRKAAPDAPAAASALH
jgi:hypothetical protein